MFPWIQNVKKWSNFFFFISCIFLCYNNNFKPNFKEIIFFHIPPNAWCLVTFTLKLFKMCHSSDSYARSVIRASAATVRRHSRIKSWKPLTVNELRRFLAIVFNMGLIKKTSIEEYWNTTMPSQSSKWFKKVMSRNRFQLILRFLYVSDHSRNVSRQVIFFNLFKN